MFHFASTVLNNTRLEQVYFIYLFNTTLYKLKPQQTVSSYKIVK